MAKHKKTAPEAECPYCGIVAKLTDDHVVPVCLFGDSIPKDIPVIPACATCNNVKKSAYDTYLRDMLVCDDDTFRHPVVQAIFNGKFSRAVSRNQSPLALHIRTKMRLVPTFTPSGIFVGYRIGVTLVEGDVSEVLGTMVRGLHQYYLNRPLAEDIKFTVHRIRDVGKVLPIVQTVVKAGILRYVPVGDSHIFNCIYGVEPTDPALTMWFLAFYSSPSSQGAIYRVTTRAKRAKSTAA